jgi:hypothetical protein
MTIRDRFPENRYAALDEVQELLRFRRFELLSFLETLGKADDAFLRYDFGDLAVTFAVNDGLFGCVESIEENEGLSGQGRRNTLIRICLEIEKGNVQKSVTYQFTVEELKRIFGTQQMRMESFGGNRNGEVQS